MYHGNKNPYRVNFKLVSVLSLSLIFSTQVNADCLSSSSDTAEAIKCLEKQISVIGANLEAERAKKIKIPKGMVAAFESVNCPNGWKGYKDAEGRFIVGTGQNSGLSRKALGEIGGLESITLSIAQMPRHQHNTPQAMDNTGPNFGLGPTRNSVHGVKWLVNKTELTSWEGSSSKIDITPPFVSLKYCIKQ